MLELFKMFITIFLAEVGDRTQITTMFYAANGKHSGIVVFITAILAIMLATSLAVALGKYAPKTMSQVPFKLISGVVFIIFGTWSIWEHYKG